MTKLCRHGTRTALNEHTEIMRCRARSVGRPAVEGGGQYDLDGVPVTCQVPFLGVQGPEAVFVRTMLHMRPPCAERDAALSAALQRPVSSVRAVPTLQRAERHLYVASDRPGASAARMSPAAELAAAAFQVQRHAMLLHSTKQAKKLPDFRKQGSRTDCMWRRGVAVHAGPTAPEMLHAGLAAHVLLHANSLLPYLCLTCCFSPPRLLAACKSPDSISQHAAGFPLNDAIAVCDPTSRP